MSVRLSRRMLQGLPEALAPDKVTLMFAADQYRRWPKGYRPSARIAAFMYPKGIPLQMLIDAREELRQDSSKELHRSFTADNSLWLRCEFEQLVENPDTRRAAALRRVLSRNRLPRDADVRVAFSLSPVQQPGNYRFTSFAHMQEAAMSIILPCTSLASAVRFLDYRQLRNVIYTQYDSLSAMRFVAMRSQEDLLYTQEFVTELALYLRQRLAESRQNGKPGRVMTVFGRGRLAAALRETNILGPVDVVACNLPGQQMKVIDLPGNVLRSPAMFHAEYHAENCGVVEGLQKFEPQIVVVEPHCGRDWTAELRGYFSVQEVLMLGPIDSPAMGSFTLPWLSHGVLPNRDTFWMYSERLERITPTGKKEFDMPTDAPYIQQGYTKQIPKSKPMCFVSQEGMSLTSATHDSQAIVTGVLFAENLPSGF